MRLAKRAEHSNWARYLISARLDLLAGGLSPRKLGSRIARLEAETEGGRDVLRVCKARHRIATAACRNSPLKRVTDKEESIYGNVQLAIAAH